MGTSITLTDEEREELMTYSRGSRLDHRYVARSRMILALADGVTHAEASSRSGLTVSRVPIWKKRFLNERIDGLLDKPRSGRPANYTEADRARVIAKACEKPGGGYTNWSQRRIAKELNMSQATVCRILSDDQLKPHKTDYWCGKSPDPEFEEKMLNIVGLYLNPPENALVLSVDEKTQIQALDRTQPELPMRSGANKRHTATYVRNGTASLIAALAVHTGEITATPIERNTSEDFLKFLKKLDRTYQHKHLHVIVDNLQIHKTPAVRDWLSRKRKFTLHFTPTYASWLNQIEIWFNMLTRDVLKGGIWQSKQQLIDQIMEYINTYNQTRAKPFCWTYDGQKRSIDIYES